MRQLTILVVLGVLVVSGSAYGRGGGSPAHSAGENNWVGSELQACTPFAFPGSCSTGEWCEPVADTCASGSPAGTCVPVAGNRQEGELCDGLTWDTTCAEGLVCSFGTCRLLCLQGAFGGEPGDTCSAMDSCFPFQGDDCIGYCRSPDLVYEDGFESGDASAWSSTTQPSCEAQYTHPAIHEFCFENPTQCGLRVDTTSSSCEDICLAGGGVCVEAFDDEPNGTCVVGASLLCSTSGVSSMLCNCSR